ncbi:MAG TPA: VPLPA-CTERM sorting domain-containing protein [Phycisphaerales bacterium]|nr:VPLPA-CTERM sorting domain-containing protein [Phycisphaerales bacterium]
MKKAISLAAIALSSSVGLAATYQFNWTAGQNIVNNSAGTFDSITATYDSSTQRFVWDVVFSNQITQGYTLAVNNGPNPKGIAGELALIHFDASTSLNSPKVTVYAYNGQNVINSWSDGNANVNGNQTPDLIKSANDTSWINSATVTDAAGKRRFLLDVNVATINGHNPLYPGGAGDWTGVQFDQMIGLWFHTFKGLSTGYGSNGQLTGWNFNTQGWFDGSNIQTVQIVPLPAAAWTGLAGLACVGVIARKRRAANK